MAARWQAHAAAVTGLAVSPRGLLASCSEDGVVKVWRGAELRYAAPARGDFLTSCAFSPDGALVAAGYDGQVRRVPWQ